MRITILTLLFSLAISGCGLLDPLNYDSEQGVPDGTIEERDAWGQKHLGVSYQRGINWIKKAEVVKQKVGNVITVAPIGKPNYIESYFTDGLQGNLTLEIIGDKGKALFYANDIAPCATGSTCFKRGILTVKDRQIEIHHSGISIEEFNRPANKIAYLSNQIKFYNRKYPQNTPPHQSNPSIYKLWSERAGAYAANKDFPNAILDMETAIALLSKNYRQSGGFHERRLKEYFHKIALYHYYLGQFDKSAEAILSAIKKNQFEENKRYLNDNHLWLWIVRMHEGQEDLANQELEEALQFAIDNKDFCAMNVARYLIGEIKEADFLQLVEENQLTRKDVYKYNNYYCDFFGSQQVFFAYYYAGHKKIIDGNIKEGKELLQKFIESQVTFGLEHDIAIYELKKIDQL